MRQTMSIFHGARGLAAAALLAAGGLFGAPEPAAAQREWLNPDVNALREEIGEMRRRLDALSAGGGVVGSGPGVLGSAAPTDVVIRLDQMENEIRRLVGEVERLTFENQALRRELGLAAAGPASAGVGGGSAALQGAPGAGPLTGAPAGGAEGGILGVLPGEGPSGPAVATPVFEGVSGAQASTGASQAPDASAAAAAPGVAAAAVAPDPAAFEEGIDLLRRNEIVAAAARFEAFIAGSPDDPRVGDAKYWLGETYFARGEFGQAAQLFLGVFRDHTDANRAPDSLLKLGMSLARLEKPVEACRTLAEVSLRYPNATPSVLRRAEQEQRNAGCS